MILYTDKTRIQFFNVGTYDCGMGCDVTRTVTESQQFSLSVKFIMYRINFSIKKRL